MIEQTKTGIASRDGVRVADVELTGSIAPQVARVDMPGTQRVGCKDLSRRGPTTIRPLNPDPGLRAELEQLLAMGRDPDVARAHRTWRRPSMSIEVDGQRFDDCSLEQPFNPYGAVEQSEFVVHHKNL